jgi:predicted N-acetyltransferase YhbS
MQLRIEHLFRHPEHLERVAGWIYDEFWVGKAGYSPEFFAGLLRNAIDPDRIPLCRVAFVDGEPVGCVNLIANDDRTRPHLAPWLAALIVRPVQRHRGIGAALVRDVLAHARRLGFDAAYFGTDIQPFYARLGAVHHEQASAELSIMRFDLGSTNA